MAADDPTFERPQDGELEKREQAAILSLNEARESYVTVFAQMEESREREHEFFETSVWRGEKLLVEAGKMRPGTVQKVDPVAEKVPALVEPSPQVVKMRDDVQLPHHDKEVELARARAEFDDIRENYPPDLNAYLRKVDSGEVAGTKTEFDLEYCLDRQYLGIKIDAAEKELEFARNSA